ncbi:MAG: hypothetical protein HY581_06030 [Nitrospirae bacterium]|nr:hypothetical protein [Nitrospirota bacterium]
MPKLEQLAHILEQHIRNGRLSDAQIQRELREEDWSKLVQGLGPDAAGLRDEISATLKATHSEEGLAFLLAGLMQQLPKGQVGPDGR